MTPMVSSHSSQPACSFREVYYYDRPMLETETRGRTCPDNVVEQAFRYNSLG